MNKLRIIFIIIVLLQTSTNITLANRLPNEPKMEFTVDISRQGYRAAELVYKNYLNYTLHLYIPGFLRTNITQEYINGELKPITYVDWGARSRLSFTGNKFDVFINSENWNAFFTIQLPFGVGYSRDGRFKINYKGELVTLAGEFPVLGEEGPILLSNDDISISNSGKIYIGTDLVAKLRISVIQDQYNLIPINGVICIHSTKNPQLILDEKAYQVKQGYLHESNVSRGTGGSKLLTPQFMGVGKVLERYHRMLNYSVKTMGSP